MRRTFAKMMAAASIAAQAAPPALAQPASPGPASATLALPHAPRDAAMTCYWATAAGMAGAKDQTGVIASAVWYLLEYLRAEKVPGDPLEHIQAMSSEEFDTGRIIGGDPAALAAFCQQRNPRNSLAAVVLPADAFQRDTLCMAVASLIVGFARSEQDDTGRSPLLDPATALMDRIAERLDDATLAARGYVGDEAVTGLISASLGQAPTHGGLIGIYRACEAVPSS